MDIKWEIEKRNIKWDSIKNEAQDRENWRESIKEDMKGKSGKIEI